MTISIKEMILTVVFAIWAIEREDCREVRKNGALLRDEK